MPFFKQIEVKDAKEKYGFSHQGLFAKEFIKKGEPIFTCDREKCDYLQEEHYHLATTKAQTEALMNQYPESRDFISKYIYMIKDDQYDYPGHFIEQTIGEDCMYFNHSCEPNSGFASLDSALVIAIRDIEINDELTYDYQCMDSEASYYSGLQCKCGSLICRGVLHFNEYRNIDWQHRMLKYSGSHIKTKVEELKTKWYSSFCCLRRLNLDDKQQLCLATLKKIPKDFLVAVFSDHISPDTHYLRNSEISNCYLVGNEVFTSNEIEPATELTLNYSNQN